MTPRRVLVTLEVITEAPLHALRSAKHISLSVTASGVDCNPFVGWMPKVVQAQANVVARGRPGRRRRSHR